MVDNDQEVTRNKVECLHKIMQDRNQHDTKQLVIIFRLSQARCLVTMDYRFYRQYNHRKKDISNKCGINMFVMTPSEFINEYKHKNGI